MALVMDMAKEMGYMGGHRFHHAVEAYKIGDCCVEKRRVQRDLGPIGTASRWKATTASFENAAFLQRGTARCVVDPLGRCERISSG